MLMYTSTLALARAARLCRDERALSSLVVAGRCSAASGCSTLAKGNAAGDDSRLLPAQMGAQMGWTSSAPALRSQRAQRVGRLDTRAPCLKTPREPCTIFAVATQNEFRTLALAPTSAWTRTRNKSNELFDERLQAGQEEPTDVRKTKTLATCCIGYSSLRVAHSRPVPIWVKHEPSLPPVGDETGSRPKPTNPRHRFSGSVATLKLASTHLSLPYLKHI
jgi:hypothetical protein